MGTARAEAAADTATQLPRILPTAPGPRGTEVGRHMLAVARDPLAALSDVVAKHGDVVRFDVAGHPVFIARGPEQVRHVFVTNQDNYRKASQYELLRPVLGRGLLTSSGDLWRRQRSLVQPMFAKRHLTPFANQMTAAAESVLDAQLRLRADGDQVDAADLMSHLTLDVVGRALFGAELTGNVADTIGNSLGEVLEAIGAVGRSPLTAAIARAPKMTMESAFRTRTRQWTKATNATDQMDAIINALVDERLANPDGGGNDLLTLLLEARDPETGEAMSRTQIRDEIATFLLAGHETTANALAWMWSLLSQHPEARERLIDEVDGVLCGRVPTADDVDLLPWTNAVIQESMRLYPPAWILEREAIAKDELGGFHVPPHSTVVIPPFLVHRNPNVWANPEGFDPRRFLPGADPDRPRHAYLPFGAGRRVCVGQGFALMEATLLAAMIAQRFTLDLVPGLVPGTDPSVTLRPRGGLPMVFRPRS